MTQSLKNRFIFTQRLWLWPLLAMIAITPWISSWDLALSHYFYKDGHFSSYPLFSFAFTYGYLYAKILIGITLLFLILSYSLPKWSAWRPIALAFILVLGIGAEGIVHLALKDHWGRPRPVQTIEFGGKQDFRPYYEPNFFHQPEPSKSFSCGHCATGFYFFALALAGRRVNNRVIFWIGLVLAIFFGGVLSLARIAQGGHFLSDTLMTALIMWLISCACVTIIPNKPIR